MKRAWIIGGIVFGLSLGAGSAALAAESAGDTQEAEYVGMETCASCHEAQAKRFPLTAHFQAHAPGTESPGGNCESCHGPGKAHAEAGGGKGTIIRESAEQCFRCHLEKRGEFQLQFHHPVPEGRMKCSSCHSVHETGSLTSTVTSVGRTDERCFTCHKEMKGPFVFEHDAMREGCAVCHNPHGAVYDKMLVADQTTVCLRCHWEQSFNTSSGQLGGVRHGSGTGGGDYFIGRGEECVDHHRAPHGSNIWRTFNR